MVRTDQAYINQYLVYDEVFEACDACEKACVEADYFLRKEARKSYLDTYFSEALNFGAKKSPAKAEDNIFAKIGKAIVNLIEKIKNAIDSVYSEDGVIILMDMGSAVMTTEMVLEEYDNDRGRKN